MKTFMGEDFLLRTQKSQELFKDYAKNQPIIDYHCHLDPKEIYEDKQYDNITQIWLNGDHYKWRLMRSNGINEKYITGDANDYDKFFYYVKTIQYAIDSPLYHWSNLELKRCFNIEDSITEKNALTIWEKANNYIKDNAYSPQKAISHFKVEALCTTDEAFSDLVYHKLISKDNKLKTKVLPTFRPDKIVQIGKETFLPSIKKLEEVTKLYISSYADFLKAIDIQLEAFNNAGCRISDIAFEGLDIIDATLTQAQTAFQKKLNNQPLSKEDITAFESYTVIYMMSAFKQYDWATQLHIAAKRNNNTAMFNKLGPDTGYDCISDVRFLDGLSKLLDILNSKDSLHKVIIYTLNPIYNHAIASLIGCFQDETHRGKIQFGAAWWFNDHVYGIKDHLKTLSSLSLIQNSLGMLTDSRSFISYPRHEFYRRILCDFIGSKVERGEFPNDNELLGAIIEKICYKNAKEYLVL